jgi:putative redox protein
MLQVVRGMLFIYPCRNDALHLKGKKLTVQANIKWTDGLQFVAQPHNQPAIVIDSPENGSGASPMAMLLMGVAGCTAIDVITILQKKRLNISRFEVNISGERASEYPRRFTHIDIEYVVHGQSVSTQAMEQAIELSETKYCGAMASMNADFSHSYRIVPT